MRAKWALVLPPVVRSALIDRVLDDLPEEEQDVIPPVRTLYRIHACTK